MTIQMKGLIAQCKAQADYLTQESGITITPASGTENTNVTLRIYAKM